MAIVMKTPNADAVLAEIDKLARALTSPWQRRQLAGLRVQVVQLVREAQRAPGPVLLP